MLFNYQYINHDIEKFQSWLDHLVKKVWCRNGGVYSLKLLHPDLKSAVEEIKKDKSIDVDHLDGPIKAIDALFQKKLTAAQRRQVRVWYDSNNNIEALCRRDANVVPATYADIKAINPNLEIALRAFCTSLFDKVIKLKAVYSRTAELDAHYDDFVRTNTQDKCPYCGLDDIKGKNHSKREAYDHFLPKGIYPFNSVNFRNLAPMCHECNSSYKLQQDATRYLDPIRKKRIGARCKAFYSYSNIPSGIKISISLLTKEIDNLSPSQIELNISAGERTEEVESWMEVFGIDERYKAKCCANNDGLAWLSRITEECVNYGLTPEQMLIAEIRSAGNKPWHDANFLKMPFLLAFWLSGILASRSIDSEASGSLVIGPKSIGRCPLVKGFWPLGSWAPRLIGQWAWLRLWRKGSG